MTVAGDSFSDRPRTVLRDLIAARGPQLARERGRLGGLLRDECGEAKREINVLLDAIDEHIVDDLMAGSDEPIDALVPRLAQRFSRHRGTAPAAALWAVISWAYALGQLDAAQLAPPSIRLARPAAVAPVAGSPLLTESAAPVRARAAPAWLPSGKAPLIAAGLVLVLGVGWFASGPKIDPVDHSPRITRVELAGTDFTGGLDTRAKIVGDGRRYAARIFYEDVDGDLASLEITNLKGTFSNGHKTNVRHLGRPAPAQGHIDSETFSHNGAGSLAMELTLVDAAGHRSKPFAIQYDAEVPPAPPLAAQPAQGVTPRPQAGRSIHIPHIPGLPQWPSIPVPPIPNPMRR